MKNPNGSPFCTSLNFFHQKQPPPMYKVCETFKFIIILTLRLYNHNLNIIIVTNNDFLDLQPPLCSVCPKRIRKNYIYLNNNQVTHQCTHYKHHLYKTITYQHYKLKPAPVALTIAHHFRFHLSQEVVLRHFQRPRLDNLSQAVQEK